MAACCDALQIHARLPVHPLSIPAVAAAFQKHSFLSHIGRLLHNQAIKFNWPNMLQSTEVPIATVLEPNTYAKLASQLYKDGVIYLHQVTTDDGSFFFFFLYQCFYFH
jgi:hypothetical protein